MSYTNEECEILNQWREADIQRYKQRCIEMFTIGFDDCYKGDVRKILDEDSLNAFATITAYNHGWNACIEASRRF